MTLFRGPLTGPKVMGIFLGAFSCIVAANLALVYFAVGSFPGIEVKHTYRDSMGFNDRRAKQELLNWKTGVGYADGEIVLHMNDAQGKPAYTQELRVVVGLATRSSEDREVAFQFTGSDYRAPADLPPGNWQARIQATSLDGVGFRQVLPLIVRAN